MVGNACQLAWYDRIISSGRSDMADRGVEATSFTWGY